MKRFKWLVVLVVLLLAIPFLVSADSGNDPLVAKMEALQDLGFEAFEKVEELAEINSQAAALAEELQADDDALIGAFLGGDFAAAADDSYDVMQKVVMLLKLRDQIADLEVELYGMITEGGELYDEIRADVEEMLEVFKSDAAYWNGILEQFE